MRWFIYSWKNKARDFTKIYAFFYKNQVEKYVPI